MKKILRQAIIIAVVFSFTTQAHAQKTSSARKTSQAGNSLSPERSKILCKAWQLDTLSEFGLDNKASGKNANDGITFVTDGSFFITQDGTASSGTWTYSAGRINTHTTNKDVPDTKMSFKIISLADSRLVLEYQAPDLTKTQYTYTPKKQ